MSSSSSSPHDPIASLLQSDDFKSVMRSVVREALGSTALDQDPPERDEQVAPPVVTELYTPSKSEKEKCPGIWPDDPHTFFRRTVSADDWNNSLRRYPKNTRVSYDPPALPSVVQCSSTFKSHDGQLARIQGDIAHVTRPIDQLLHQVLSAGDVPAESEELIVNFANHMREQLELLASKITTVRMDNLRKDKGLPASDTANLLIDPQTFNEEIKAAKSLSAAFAPQKSTSSSSNFNRRGKSGKQDQQQQRSRKYSDKGGNSDKHSYSSRKYSGDQSDDDSDRGRHRSSFHRAKGKDTRRDSRHRGRSNTRRSSDRQ
ncbi:hypothetical protein BGZ72_002823 [Mortierella alpina]|nr:hypothetical protein BGZ72_002823 [Mortierella alpina]